MLKMLSLHDFDGPAFDDAAAVGLLNDVMHYCDHDKLQDESQPFYKYLRNYPEVPLIQDIPATRDSIRTVSANELFLPIHDSAFKKIVSIWREKGLSEAICFAAAADPHEITTVVHWIATRLKKVLDFMDRGIYHRDLLPTSGDGSVADIVATRDWNTSLVRCMSWHPYCYRLAVATRDDRIRIFSPVSTNTTWMSLIQPIPILRHSEQKSVCCLNWRPNSGRELAVACYYGVLVWTIELSAASNLLSHAIHLKQRNHAPVTSVTWHPQGDLLASCSPTDLNIIIWDICKEEGVPLRRVGGGGICFTCWSSCGSRLFSASCGNVFRVWNTGVPTPWHTDKWIVPNGRVAVACFGPNLTLLFATTEDPATIFSLPLQDNIFDDKKTNNNDVKIAMRLIDLTKVNFSSDDNDDYVTVGGRIISMEWNLTGRYLAIIFQDSPVITLFKTTVSKISRVVEVQPSCLIKGFPGEVPNCMNFYQRDTSYICLTIAWSSGRIQHFPIVEDHDKLYSVTSIYGNKRIV
ncbi:aladin [Harpegnathos saltator]|uniref:aladin n=1 Tax=Harpegnathos saltator TaxID=610380 RepID=UPI000DBED898|nr:aladin [Harpegnathos saltator]XP_011144903.2 aladin [Harpegnathos saltator]XP_011144906.2 aladin [Harpegnathos saltator]XP_011144911.2 aladin [Harpegnathos saltator]XP_011144912.2 aladin [Harpegnathos saltator]XP_011144914.2 aladin [Harpegnathos saltator]XP_025156559.1 aladin [Harpegnathos saltator]XP_025156560.1 aladin [Harpegnathos saltator]